MRIYMKTNQTNTSILNKDKKYQEIMIGIIMELKHFTTEQTRQVGENLGIKWDKFDIEQFRIGMEVELEHGKRDSLTNVTNDDIILTGKIALAHLNEFPDYYTRLIKMEKEADEFWKKDS